LVFIHFIIILRDPELNNKFEELAKNEQELREEKQIKDEKEKEKIEK